MSRLTIPQRYVKDYGTLLTDFTTILPDATSGTMTQNEASATHFISGTQGWWMKLEGATDSLGQAKFDIPLDLMQTKFIDVWIYDNSGNNVNDLGSDIIINFFAETDAYPSAVNKYKWSNGSTAWPDSPDHGGKWKCVRYHIDEASPTSAAGLANIQWFMIELDNRGGQDAEIWIDSIYIHKKERSKLIWMFDDGSESDYSEAFDYLYTTKGKKGTSFVISETVAGGSEMTLAQAQEMYAAGWDIANHSNDATTLTSVSTSAAIGKLDACRDYLIANGMPDMAEYFAYPSNASSAALISALNADGKYKFGRASQKSTTHFPNVTGHPDSPQTPPFDPLYFAAGLILNEVNYDAGGGSGAVQKAYALDAAGQGASIMLSAHKIVASGAIGVQTNQASFREFVDWTIEMEEAGYWDIVSLKEWKDGMSGKRMTVDRVTS